MTAAPAAGAGATGTPAGAWTDDRILVVVAAQAGLGTTTVACLLATAVGRHARRAEAAAAEPPGGPVTLLDVARDRGCAAVLGRRMPSAVPDPWPVASAGGATLDLDPFTLADPGLPARVVVAPASWPIAELTGRIADPTRTLVVDVGAVEVADRARLAVAATAGDLVVVTTIAAPAVHATRRLVRALTAGGVDPDRIHLVVNQAVAGTGMTPDLLADLVPTARIAAVVPAAYRDVVTAVNRGTVADLLDHPLVGPPLLALARQVVGLPELSPADGQEAADGPAVLHHRGRRLAPIVGWRSHRARGLRAGAGADRDGVAVAQPAADWPDADQVEPEDVLGALVAEFDAYAGPLPASRPPGVAPAEHPPTAVPGAAPSPAPAAGTSSGSSVPAGAPRLAVYRPRVAEPAREAGHGTGDGSVPPGSAPIRPGGPPAAAGPLVAGIASAGRLPAGTVPVIPRGAAGGMAPVSPLVAPQASPALRTAGRGDAAGQGAAAGGPGASGPRRELLDELHALDSL